MNGVVALKKAREYTDLAQLGLTSITVNGLDIILTRTDGSTAVISVPIPDPVSIEVVELNKNKEIVITLTDGTTKNLGIIPTVKGDKGDDGFSPTITENENNTDDVYKLDIINSDGTFTTPNLKGKDGDGSTIEISKEENNALVEKEDGLYVSVTSEIKVSSTENNQIQTKNDGIYVAPTDLTKYSKTDEVKEFINNPYEYVIDSSVYGADILKYELGHYKIGNNSTIGEFTNLPIANTGMLDVMCPASSANNSPWDSAYGYRYYRYTVYTGGTYERFLESSDTAGTISVDSGWRIIAYKDEFLITYKSIAETGITTPCTLYDLTNVMGASSILHCSVSTSDITDLPISGSIKIESTANNTYFIHLWNSLDYYVGYYVGSGQFEWRKLARNDEVLSLDGGTVKGATEFLNGITSTTFTGKLVDDDQKRIHVDFSEVSKTTLLETVTSTIAKGDYVSVSGFIDEGRNALYTDICTQIGLDISNGYGVLTINVTEGFADVTYTLTHTDGIYRITYGNGVFGNWQTLNSQTKYEQLTIDTDNSVINIGQVTVDICDMGSAINLNIGGSFETVGSTKVTLSVAHDTINSTDYGTGQNIFWVWDGNDATAPSIGSFVLTPTGFNLTLNNSQESAIRVLGAVTVYKK